MSDLLGSLRQKFEQRQRSISKLLGETDEAAEQQNEKRQSNLRQSIFIFIFQKGYSFCFFLKVESFLVDYLSDPLIDLPVYASDLLTRLAEQCSQKITEQDLHTILYRFCADFKLIK